jgi:ribosomal protein S18 acetylase RimI-like enzyme
VTWSIRPGTAADADALLALWSAAAAEETVSDDVESIANMLARDAGALLLAEADGALIGSLIVGWDGWRGQLYRLAVDPAWRRRGVATALVRAAEERLRGLGARRVAAIVITSHDHAQSFWRSVGYEAAPQTRYVRSL